MKKIYFIASMLLIGSAATAQVQDAITARSNGYDVAINSNDRPELDQNRAPGDPINPYTDDFSNAGNWNLANSSSPGNDFTIDATGATVGAAFASTTAANGFAWYDCDAQGTGSTVDATVTYGTVMDLSSYPAVAVQFESYYIEYQTNVYVEVSTNGMSGPWTQYEIHTDVTDNNASANPETIIVNISAQAGSQANVAVRFHYTGGWGFAWSIDDFQMVEAYQNELETTWANFSSGTEAVEYYAIPTSQITEITFGSIGQSNGVTTQTNVQMTADVDGGSTYSGTSGQSVTLMEGQSDTFSIEAGNGWTPSGAGTYDLVIGIGGDQTEELAGNNTWEPEDITVGGNIYTRDDGLLGGGFVGFISTQGDPIAVGNVMEVFSDITFGKIDIGISTAANNEGQLIYGAVYKWNGSDFTLETQTSDYTTTAADLGAIVSLDLPNDYTAFTGDILVVVAGRYSDDPMFGTAQGTYNGSVVAFHTSGTLGGADPEAIICRINTNPSEVGIEEQPAVTGLNIFPNPADKVTLLTYTVVNEGKVGLTMTDLTGKVVYTENYGSQTAGEYNVEIGTDNLSNGVYFYTITVNEKSLTKKFVVSH